MRKAIFLPGIIAPAALRYQALLALMPDVEAVTKDLEVYSSDAPPVGYSMQTEIDSLERAADAAGFDRFHLYGHSGGGAVALAYVAARPDRVLSLAIDEPASDHSPEAHAHLALFGEARALPAGERMRAFLRLQVSDAVEPPPPPPGPPPPWMARRPAGIEAFIVALEAHEVDPARYARFERPVLFTYGELTHPSWFDMHLRLWRSFPNFESVMFEGLHHLNTSHQAEPGRVVTLLKKLWDRAEA